MTVINAKLGLGGGGGKKKPNRFTRPPGFGGPPVQIGGGGVPGVQGPPGVRGGPIGGDTMPSFDENGNPIGGSFPTPGIDYTIGGPKPFPVPIGGFPGRDLQGRQDKHGRNPNDPNYMRGTYAKGTFPGAGGGSKRPAGGGGFRDWWAANQDHAGSGFGYSAAGDAADGADKRLLHMLFNQGMGRGGLNALTQNPRLLGSLEGPNGGYGALRDYLGADRGNVRALGQFARGWENQTGQASPYGQTANQNAAFKGLPGFYNQYVSAATGGSGTGINGYEDSPYWSQDPRYWQGRMMPR